MPVPSVLAGVTSSAVMVSSCLISLLVSRPPMVLATARPRDCNNAAAPPACPVSMEPVTPTKQTVAFAPYCVRPELRNQVCTGTPNDPEPPKSKNSLESPCTSATQPLM